MSTDENGQIKVKPATVAVIASCAAAIGTFITVAITHGRNVEQLEMTAADVSGLKQRDLIHDQAIANLGGDIKEIKRDVSWIRSALRKGEQP